MNQRGKKKNELKEMRTISETSRTILNYPTFESGVPEEEDKKKDHEKILEEIRVENFPKMEKEIIPPSPRNPESPKQDKPSKTPQDTY